MGTLKELYELLRQHPWGSFFLLIAIINIIREIFKGLVSVINAIRKPRVIKPKKEKVKYTDYEEL